MTTSTRAHFATTVALGALIAASSSLAAPAVPPLSAPAPAPTSKASAPIAPAPTAAAPAAGNSRVDRIEKQVQELSQQVQDLKRPGASPPSDQQREHSADVKVTLANGRPTFTSADGDFSASLRSIVQFDAAYYAQNAGPSAATPDLSSGTNLRRARIGLEGKVFRDWEYSFIYDFGGSGVEGTTITQAYIQYDGLAPVTIRVGAFPPFASLEDSAGAGDTLFLERASINEIARTVAGAEGRSAVAVFASGDRYLASLAYTGSRVGQSGMFDEQQALLGRVAAALVSTPDAKLVVGANGSYVFDPADAAPGPGAPSSGVIFQNSTELRVDATNLVSTGNINSDSVTHWGADAGALWKSFYAEGGYTRFDADRRASTNPHFDGWYTQLSLLLTGESRRYDTRSASFRSPTVAHPVNGHGGWGAFELAAKYSELNLNFREGVAGAATPAGGVRGGEQKIWTGGLNWYPNSAVRVALNYQNADIDRLDAAGVQIGQKIDQVSLRVQFAI